MENNSKIFQGENSESEPTHESNYIDQLDETEQQALRKRILVGIKSGIREREEKAKQKERALYFSKIAASFLLLIALSFGLWHSVKQEQVRYSTGSNETLKINLPDGSIAMLNSNSSLSYSYNRVSGFDRKVELTGEAFFDIAKNDGIKKFIINEGEVMEVEVFGTEFNFKNQHPVHKLTLLEGSVKLGYQGDGGNENRMVVPGETIKLNLDNHQIESKTVPNPLRLLAWQERKLRMQNESLEEVLEVVTELYDLEIIDQKIPPTNQLISGSLPLTDNANEVINNIEVLFNTKINLEKNSIRIP
ncbi:ferric-dicitrate binding protein FerR, regulates iron transport through sigma-19 [Algoriphagus locisalis]|uniref:Ferric-dicitrate binding protein FerR, regulates iron transport through sigma-19 n=2 Tax=Algoriphagus locisalis TaxID=305507 RepID=A0A1I7DV34_9BACT|nr:ferric-dicitrate binding protein FerR, regulates iron transport through sigma-19 [Algoriphagus locisalis]